MANHTILLATAPRIQGPTADGSLEGVPLRKWTQGRGFYSVSRDCV